MHPGRCFVAVICGYLLASPADGGPVVLPDGGRVEQVDFERHVQGLLGKLGCNAGACHGSFQGKGGLYLSLFGHSPEKDLLAFTRDGLGRRVSVANPEESLLLLKAAGLVPHGGGKRLDRGSWQWHVLREWVAGGATWTAGSGAVTRIEVTPGEMPFEKPGGLGSFRVHATFADGTREDVTGFCQFQVNDEYVAELDGPAGIRAVRPGDTAVVISYRGHVQAARVLVRVPQRADFVYPKVPEVNLVDRAVFAKLRKLNVVPSDLSGDAEFLRRVTIDTIGSLPDPDEVRRFVADPDPEKRARKVDELLKHPLHAALWATKFSDITGNNIDTMEQSASRTKKAKMWHDWFRKRIADNVPYDEIVKGVLTATSREGRELEDFVKHALTLEVQALGGWDSDYADRETLDLFWRRTRFPIEQMGEHTAAAFLGIRLECAQCHKHPFDRWTQEDYHSYAAIFAPVRFTTARDAQALVSRKLTEMRAQSTAELKELNTAYAEKKRPLEEKIDQEYAGKRKEAEAKAEEEIAEKQKALEAKTAKASESDRKKAFERFEREKNTIRQRHLSRLAGEIASKKRSATANLDRELQDKRKEIQQKYRLPSTQMREVTLQPPPPPRPGDPKYTPRALGGPEIAAEGDPRPALFAWMRSADNPYFAPSFVNRVWAHYFGRGIVDPVDNFSVANPPSNPALLDALARDFIESGYDIRRLERTILLSRTYQLSAMPNETNRDDRVNHSRSYPRRLMAEAVVDVLNTALGVSENFGNEAPPGVRAIEIATNRLQQNQNLANVFRLFGRPTRAATCDCERPAEPALPQTLFLMTDPTLLKKITDGRVKGLLASDKSDEELVEELVLATLSRFPSDREKARLVGHVRESANRESAYVDIVWALINMREFILNH